MKSVLCCLALFFSYSLPAAHAFLGDDQSTIESRYGKMLRSSEASDGSLMATYESTGFRITINFVKGHADCETFYRLGPTKEFSDELIRTFLRAHASGQTWLAQGDSGGRRNWHRPGAIAAYSPDDVLGPSLMICAFAASDDVSPTAPPVSATQPISASASSEPKTIATVIGTGEKTSDPFKVSATTGFTVEYETSGQVFSVRVHQVGQKQSVAHADLNAPGKEHTFVPAGPGAYYLSIIASGAYTIKVRE